MRVEDAAPLWLPRHLSSIPIRQLHSLSTLNVRDILDLSVATMASPDTQRNGTARKVRFNGNDTGLWETVQRFWAKSYAGDYLGLMLLLAAYILMHFGVQPFHKLFRLDDTRIQFPHAEVERVDVCT